MDPIHLEKELAAARCDKCGGHWISAKNYSAWLERQDGSFPNDAYSDVSFDIKDAKAAKICPDCGSILIKYKVGHGLDFYLDHCDGCGGVWLDQNEWKALKAMNIHGQMNRIFSTVWQSHIREETLRSKLEQVYTNRMGADGYRKIKEVREWIHQHPQKAALLAYLNDEDPYRL